MSKTYYEVMSFFRKIEQEWWCCDEMFGICMFFSIIPKHKKAEWFSHSAKELVHIYVCLISFRTFPQVVS